MIGRGQHYPPSTFMPGMIVRFPVDIEDSPTDFREFRIGRLEQIDEGASVATIRALIYDLSEPDQSGDVTIKAAEHFFERSLDQIARCRILQDSPFQSVEDPATQGRVLGPCQGDIPAGALLDYYVHVGRAVRRMSEASLMVGSTRQDPDPVHQALAYELQNPSWHIPRDRVVEAYSELRGSTFGIEDLVGSRVFLLAHQAEVIARVLSSPECRFMLADEVGLGKTIEASVILKALRRRDPNMATLIIVPASLTHQWRNELSKKFWLDLPIVQPGSGAISIKEHPGVIISAEALTEHTVYWDALRRQNWGLVIIDEAQHLQKSQTLYDRVCELSEAARGVLILTATPIQRRAEEYLALLRLLDPRRYRSESAESFRWLLEAQQPIRAAITLAQPLLDAGDADGEELLEELEPLGSVLGDDATLADMLSDLADMEDSPQDAREVARQIVAYVSANYRIESRMIRNRRANLQITLPQRTLDTSYSYAPTGDEERVLDDLSDYAQSYLSAVGSAPLGIEYVRALLHSAASSPQALCEMLGWRAEALRQADRPARDEPSLLSPSAPRQEAQRLRCLLAAAPTPDNDRPAVEQLARQAQQWRERSEQLLSELRLSTISRPAPDRVAQCLRAAYLAVDGRREAKVLIFASWAQTAALLVDKLRALLGRGAVEQFVAGMDDSELQTAADRFQSEEECCILVCDELGGEGRNFQIADIIIHADIPWTPAQVEQRIGRVDRLGRAEDVRSVPVFARGTVEHDLFRLWDEGLGLFTRSMSGMEIALESTQNQLTEALARSVRQGLADLLDPVRKQSDALREEVEKERLYEKESDDKELRRQFATIGERYRDGSVIRDAVHQWTSMAGLSNFQMRGDTMAYETRNFRLNAMRKARFLPPSMAEATRRLGNKRTTQIIGTFSRDIAVRREDLVFFAPGDDPWTDAVITNALECDRGRCCAVGFHRESAEGGPFFELLYSFQINPQWLYEARLDPIYLLHAQSYLPRPHLRLLVEIDGATIRRTDPRWTLVDLPFKASPLTHLGERKVSGRDGRSALERFRERYPADVWFDMVRSCEVATRQFIQDDVIEYAAERADDAAREFSRRVAGWEAGLRWQARNGSGSEVERPALEEYRQATEALVTGIRRPIIRLESICFWDPSEVGR
ncbi:MAG: DEAD/DEAH box helicase family protein [Oscillochloris sp.]|nr:DEAD/DEAH box helicase family protein [Oscillochloris sp.]